jgi:hypothetical protein
MPKTKKPKAKFVIGNAVHSTMLPGETLFISEEPQWNGHTYMYAFKDQEMRCGEDYLTFPKFTPHGAQ